MQVEAPDGNADRMGNELSRVKGRTCVVGSHSVKVRSLLAEGGFSFCFVVVDSYSREVLVLKRMRIVADNEEAVALAHREFALVETLPPHPHVIRFIDGAWRSGTGGGVDHGPGLVEVDILMEFASGGTAMAEVAAFRARGERMPEARVLRRWRDLVSGVAHLHAQHPAIAHRDIKLENLLLVPARVATAMNAKSASAGLDSGVGAGMPTAGSVTALADSDGRCFVGKLADFGSCWPGDVPLRTDSEIADVEASIERTTTLAFRAPELIDLRSGFARAERSARVLRGPPADVWALGVALYQLAFSVTPFEDGASGVPSRIAIANAKYSLPPRGAAPYSPGLHALIAACLAPRPDDRPTAAALLQRGAALSQWPQDDALPHVVQESRHNHGEPQLDHRASNTLLSRDSGNKSMVVDRTFSASTTVPGVVAARTSQQTVGVAHASSHRLVTAGRATASHAAADDWSSDLAASGIAFTQSNGRNNDEFAIDWGDATVNSVGAALHTAQVAPDVDDDLRPYPGRGGESTSSRWSSGTVAGGKSGRVDHSSARPASDLISRAARRVATAAGAIGDTVAGMLGSSAAEDSVNGSGRGGVLVEQLETRMLQLLGGEENSVRRWVVKATSLAPGPPKAKYVRRLVLHAYDVDDTMANRGTSGSVGDVAVHVQISMRPLGNPIVALKACGLLLRLWALGPSSALPASAVAIAALDAASGSFHASSDPFVVFTAGVVRATVAKARLLGAPLAGPLQSISAIQESDRNGAWSASDAHYGLEHLRGSAASALGARRGARGDTEALTAAFAAALESPGIAPPLTSLFNGRGGERAIEALEAIVNLLGLFSEAISSAESVPGTTSILRSAAAHARAPPEESWPRDVVAGQAMPTSASALHSTAGILPALIAEAAELRQVGTVAALLLLAAVRESDPLTRRLLAGAARLQSLATSVSMNLAIDAVPMLSDHPSLRGQVDSTPTLPRVPPVGSPASDPISARMTAAAYLAATMIEPVGSSGGKLQYANSSSSAVSIAPDAGFAEVRSTPSGGGSAVVGPRAPPFVTASRAQAKPVLSRGERQVVVTQRASVSGGLQAQPLITAPVDVAAGLATIRRTPGNELCAECGARVGASAWASVNLGLVFCLRCSGVHRGLGVHITQVRSLSLDTWKPQWILRVLAVGNVRGAQFWEASLQAGGPAAAIAAGKPTPASSMGDVARWCRAKYETRKWAPVGIPSPDEALDAGVTDAAVNTTPTLPRALPAATPPQQAEEFDPWGTLVPPASAATDSVSIAPVSRSSVAHPWVDPWAAESPYLAAAAATSTSDRGDAPMRPPRSEAAAPGLASNADDDDDDGFMDGSGSEPDDPVVDRIETLRSTRLQRDLLVAAAASPHRERVETTQQQAGFTMWASDEDLAGAFI